MIPLTVESYNQYLDDNSASAASDLTRFKLPTPSDATSSALPSHLLVLVGNSRALWAPFLEFVYHEMGCQENGPILPNPIDRYVQKSIQETIQAFASDARSELLAPVEKVYWVADTEPGKMILAQKMALAAGRVSHCPVRRLRALLFGLLDILCDLTIMPCRCCACTCPP